MMPSPKQYFYGRQSIDGQDIARVSEALASDLISQGPNLTAFEAGIAERVGAKHCLAVCNGTAALHLACLALGLTAGDKAWTSPMTFAASANCMRFCNATPDFVDIDPETWNMSVPELKAKLEQAARDNALPKVLIPVHFAGLSCDMAAIAELCAEYGVKIIEDACQAMGGQYRNAEVGCCEFSDITTYSLHPVKSMTTGEGGIILTNDDDLYAFMASMRAHGLTKRNDESDPFSGPWHVETVGLGYNYRITDFQCALGRSQLEKLDGFLAKRRELAARYEENLKNLPVALQRQSEETLSARHMMILRIDFEGMGIDKRTFHANMAAKGINLFQHYYPVHLHQPYRELGFGEGMFPEAERYFRESFTFPLHPGLEVDDIDYICDQVKAQLP